MSNYDATTGTDTVTQTPDGDAVTVTDTNQIQATDFFDGNGGLDAIVVGTPAGGAFVDIDLRSAGIDATHGFHNYQAVIIVNESGFTVAQVAAAQFGAGLISTSLDLVGRDTTQQSIWVTEASSFSAAAWTFEIWEANDIVQIDGTINADTITGSRAHDVISGFDGSDTLTGGLGQDELSGGAEADTFNFDSKAETLRGANRDVIISFVHLEDHIDLKGIDAKKGHGNQAFHFIGKQGFHHTAGELQVKYNAVTDIAIVQGDIDGNGKADFQIEVHSAAALGRGDFLL